MAVPGDEARANQLLAVREAVPAAVNQRVGRAKQTIDARIEKTAADMVVPFDRLEELLTAYETAFGARGLDVAIWGHISDGNLHPNVIPRSLADVESGKAAILELGREAIRLGGAPLAEHGVGRNRVKQRLLEQLYGEDGIDEMRAVKRAIDPEWKLAPGVLFTRDFDVRLKSGRSRAVIRRADRSVRLQPDVIAAISASDRGTRAAPASAIRPRFRRRSRSTCGFSPSTTLAVFDAPVRSMYAIVTRSPGRWRPITVFTASGDAMRSPAICVSVSS